MSSMFNTVDPLTLLSECNIFYFNPLICGVQLAPLLRALNSDLVSKSLVIILAFIYLFFYVRE